MNNDWERIVLTSPISTCSKFSPLESISWKSSWNTIAMIRLVYQSERCNHAWLLGEDRADVHAKTTRLKSHFVCCFHSCENKQYRYSLDDLASTITKNWLLAYICAQLCYLSSRPFSCAEHARWYRFDNTSVKVVSFRWKLTKIRAPFFETFIFNCTI